MKTYSSEELQEKFKTLPKQLQEAIGSAHVEQKVLEIAKRNGLHIDQSTDLIAETGLVMFGLSPTAEYTRNIQKRLNISSEKARHISQDINEEIFKEIKEALLQERVNNEGGALAGEEIVENGASMAALSQNKIEASSERILKEIEGEPTAEPVPKQAEQSSSPAPNAPASASVPDQSTEVPAAVSTNITQEETEEGAPVNIMEQKLSGEFKIPSTEKIIDETETPAAAAPTTPAKIDPYREPIE